VLQHSKFALGLSCGILSSKLIQATSFKKRKHLGSAQGLMVCTFSLVPNLLPASWPQEFEASVWSNFCPSICRTRTTLSSAWIGFNQRIGSNSDTKQTMKLYGQEFKYVNLPHGPHMPKQCLTSVENRLIWIQFDKCSHVPTKRNAQGYNFYWWDCDHPSIKLPTAHRRRVLPRH